MTTTSSHGLSLAPFRALRYTADADRLGRLLCPPYDVIDDVERARLLDAEPDNAVALILPNASDGGDPYAGAAERLARWSTQGLVRADAEPALYVYEMRTADGQATRGLLGAVELREARDGVILPHENTMAGPVADRLALMTATQANLEPIYLVYDGGGAASTVVSGVDELTLLASATTPDRTEHRLWAIIDPATHAEVEADLNQRRALIADGHHRYATYLELQRRYRVERGAGPWDRGLTLLVDSSAYGPQVHAIHRVLAGFPLSAAVDTIAGRARVALVDSPEDGLDAAAEEPGFAAVLSDGDSSVLVADLDPALIAGAVGPGEPAAIADLDVTVLHRGLVGPVWGLVDDVDAVRYAHSVTEALVLARQVAGTAVLLRATPVAAVAAVAAAGARMPRKSTLFTPKPASGLVFRRFSDG